MADDTTIELQTVVQRFRESGDALESLKARLQTLATAESVQTKAAKSIETASSELRAFVKEIEVAVSALATTCQQAQVAMDAARVFLEGTDLLAVKSGLDSIGQSVDDLKSELAGGIATELALVRQQSESSNVSLLHAIESFSTRFEHELADAHARASTATAAREALEARIAAVPEKSRRKLGL